MDKIYNKTSQPGIPQYKQMGTKYQQPQNPHGVDIRAEESREKHVWMVMINGEQNPRRVSSYLL